MRITRILFVLLLIIIGGLVIGCAGLSSATNSSSSSLSLPSSQYPVDIIGYVTFAKNVTSSGRMHTPTSGYEYWIVQTSVRNKAYQIPIYPISTAHWTIGKENDQRCMVGSAIEDFAAPSVTIPQGQSGELLLWFIVQAGLNPSDYQICLSGYAPKKEVQIPDSYGKLVNTNTVAEVYDWDSKKIIKVAKERIPIPKIDIPSGTYTLTVMGLKETATFKSNNILEMYSELQGKRVFRYSISSDGNSIALTNLVTNETATMPFKYVKEVECVVIGNASYYK